MLNEMFPGRVEYECEKIPYVIEAYYLPDFKVTLKDGTVFYIEAKGNGRAWDSDVRRKMTLVKAQHPELDIRILFYSDGEFGARRANGSRQRQSDWANKNNYKYAIRQFPKGFFD